jgi:hypothetical protein
MHGEWTLSRSDEPGKVMFSLRSSANDGSHFSSSSDWDPSQFKGLDWSTTAKQDVHFEVIRDAGNMDCIGFTEGNEGAGLFSFTPNAGYAAKMAALGFAGVNAENQFAFALHDVSLSFAQGIKSAGIGDVGAEKLIAFRIHGVSPEFIQQIRAAGVEPGDGDRLIAFRIHGVSPEFVKALARLGYSHPSPDQLIALRIHGVTPEYIESLRSHGIQNVSLDQLVALRIHGIN